ncbi:MAG: cobyrinate a,c-diamide synthase [Hyphomicrobiaceae bacterium]|nr:cobyrinate a,c-diamide synthase [Hyphomicrobiaceae bacterium]
MAAAHKSSGKTTVMLGLARALAGRGLGVQTFKKGPDYIDPMWHQRATGRVAYNLDFNTQSAGEITDMLAAKSVGSDIALIEGNMGFYDGVDIEGRDSNAALAKLTGSPVILVIDSEGMTRGIAPLLIGYRAFDPEVHIAGVVLNRVAGARHEEKLRQAVERYTQIPVVGTLPRSPSFALPERHLGLTTPGETGEVDAYLDRIAEAVTETFDLEALLSVARLAAPLAPVVPAPATPTPVQDRVTIAIARDRAFGFYYPDDLEALQGLGAELVAFDTLHDTRLPQVDGLFIGGGFPETNMAALAANVSLRGAIKAAIEAGLPTYAECGGLMYLTRAIRWGDQTAEMVGVIPGEAVMHPRPQGRGQIVIEPMPGCPWSRYATPPSGGAWQVKAHEFHHASIAGLPEATCYAFRIARGRGIDGTHDGIVLHNMLAAFAHQRSTQSNRWAERFLAHVRAVKAERRPGPCPPFVRSASGPLSPERAPGIFQAHRTQLGERPL